MRDLPVFLLILAGVASCTPEAIEVYPDGGIGGNAGASGAGILAGSAGVAQGGGTSTGGIGGIGGRLEGGSGGNCAALTSPRLECVPCLERECATQTTACNGTDCTCRRWSNSTGQMNCLLACTTLTPERSAADACSAQCGFTELGRADPTTRALFDCAVNPPSGPPKCPACFTPH